MATPVTSDRPRPIIGHQRQLAQIRRIVTSGQYPLAMLITGAHLVGRKTLAGQFAAAALCPNVSGGVACNNCGVCVRIAAGSCPDVELWSVDRQEREGATSRSAALAIDTVRKIAASTAFRPRDGTRRFIIVEDAETLGDAAQQALLKTLEDLPAFATIILIATNAGSMLDTVRSRCMELPLQLVPTAEIAENLDHPAAAEIAAMAGGRPGWAIRASIDSTWLESQRKGIDALETWLRMSKPERLIEAYVRGDRFSRDRRLVLDDLDRVQLIWRDIALTAANAPEHALDPVRAKHLTAGSTGQLSDWHRALAVTQQCIRDLTGNIRPRLAMQAMVNQWPTLS